MRILRSLVLVLFLGSLLAFAEDPLHSEKGVIRDAATAVAVGEAILSSVYGKKSVEADRPYRAELDGDRWHIYHPTPPLKSGEVMFGGGYHITLARDNGRVLEMGFDE